MRLDYDLKICPFRPQGTCNVFGTLAALGIGLATSAGSAATSIIGANKQAGAAEDAAQLQYQAQQNALDFQKQQWQTQQANEAPWLRAGQGAVTDLYNLVTGGGFPDWTGQFKAPTAAEAAQTPGYQFQLQQGQEALQRSAAAKGNLLSSGTLKALDQYSQGLASENYQQTYNNALQQYLQSYNQFQQNQANKYNRLAGLSGTGQVAAGQLGSQGQAAASNVGNIYQVGAQQIGNSLQNAAYQTASGYNAAGNALQGAGNLGWLYSMMNSKTTQTAPFADYGGYG